ncbi:hypothetical protein [Novosphingobium sp. G106]|uniref:hypothetical protein n=1 Tax=Novosphingobium sp. G106 TaxID=2849500 RepID=UPI0020C4525E|nr:hypothetical protein [Novosphingobium sp. G106]
MPARPAPSTRTLAPLRAPVRFGGPVNWVSAAWPSAVIAWYMAMPPPTLPMALSSSRRVGADSSAVIVCVP